MAGGIKRTGGIIASKTCEVCGAPVIRSRVWRGADSYIHLPSPPADMVNSIICDMCYKDGLTMEQRIRNQRHKMAVAQGVYAYKAASSDPWKSVTDNSIMHDFGKRQVAFPDLPRIEMPDGSDGLICIGCQTYSPWVTSNCMEGFKCCNCKN